MISRATVSRTVLWGLAAGLALALTPSLDLGLSHQFYRPDGGFWMNHLAVVRWVYRNTRWLVVAVAIFLLGGLAWTLLRQRPLFGVPRARYALALAALLIGPGLIAHTGFKDHWGRPRPRQIVEFGGTAHYVPPWQPSRQCSHNCSFVSGHVCAGALLMAGGLLWPRQRRRWLWAGLAAGALIGAVRIVQGAHFLSDVLGALALTWASVAVADRLARHCSGAAPPD